MHDVSLEPLMLRPSGTPSSKLGHFLPTTTSPRLGLCIYCKAINIDKHLSSGVLPSRQSIMLGTVLAHLLRWCTRLLMVLPSRQQSAMCNIESCDCSKTRTIKNPLRLMHDVSCESLMLWLSENPQASLDIFCQPHHHPVWVLHQSQGDKQG